MSNIAKPPPPNTTIIEKLRDAELSPKQRGALDRLRQAAFDRVQANERYGHAIKLAKEAGVSFGMMGMALGLQRESVWRSLERYLKRAGVPEEERRSKVADPS